MPDAFYASPKKTYAFASLSLCVSVSFSYRPHASSFEPFLLHPSSPRNNQATDRRPMAWLWSSSSSCIQNDQMVKNVPTERKVKKESIRGLFIVGLINIHFVFLCFLGRKPRSAGESKESDRTCVKQAMRGAPAPCLSTPFILGKGGLLTYAKTILPKPTYVLYIHMCS